ncbi:response regulator transcription factor [Fulvivirga lutea]|uniref:Response regulator transcription factor n=2 Tax=Fulvivirga lutea TaxID=2810512 RepID=A0A975A3A0_9BACT|nr:response regulator transcription factor [Fulvivirga lutea]
MVLIELSNYSVYTANHYREFLIAISAIALVVFGFLLRNQLISKSLLLKSELKPDDEKLALLQMSKREFEVLVKIAEGRSNSEIADLLFVSENTIKTHVSNIFSKLNVKRRTEAIKQAKEYGLL